MWVVFVQGGFRPYTHYLGANNIRIFSRVNLGNQPILLWGILLYPRNAQGRMISRLHVDVECTVQRLDTVSHSCPY